jgi:hypothetical protein
VSITVRGGYEVVFYAVGYWVCGIYFDKGYRWGFMSEVFKKYVSKKIKLIEAAKIRVVGAYGSESKLCQVELTGSPRGEVVSVTAVVKPVKGDFVVRVNGLNTHVQKAEFSDKCMAWEG